MRVRTTASSFPKVLAVLWRGFSHFYASGSTFKYLVYFVLNCIWVACIKCRNFSASSSLPEIAEAGRRKEMPLEIKLVFECMEVVLEAAQTGSRGIKSVIDIQSHELEKVSNTGRMHNLISLMNFFLAFFWQRTLIAGLVAVSIFHQLQENS